MDSAVPADTIVRDTEREAKGVLKGLCSESPRVRKLLKTTALVGAYEDIAGRVREFKKLGISQIIFKLSPMVRELDHIERLLRYLR